MKSHSMMKSTKIALMVLGVAMAVGGIGMVVAVALGFMPNGMDYSLALWIPPAFFIVGGVLFVVRGAKAPVAETKRAASNVRGPTRKTGITAAG